jgi:hypothetical protein
MILMTFISFSIKMHVYTLITDNKILYIPSLDVVNNHFNKVDNIHVDVF